MTSPDALTIDALDTDSPTEIETFWRVRDAAHRADRPDAVVEGLGAFRRLVADPSEYHDRVWLLARAGGEVVGTGELELPLDDNAHVGRTEIGVLPDARRRGVARALHDEAVRRARAAGRTTLLAEVNVPESGDVGAVAFAEAAGYRSVHLEHHLRLDLPLPADRLASLGETHPDYEMVSWTNACPPRWRTAYVAMRNQMNADVPTGDVDLAPVVLTDERLAASEARLASSYRTLVAAARHRGTGDFAGYTVVFLPHDDATLAWQDDTLVMPDHRGRRLGLALKRANLERIAADHPTRTAVHTWTDPTNTAMYRTNERVGFRCVELMREMELGIA